MTRFTYGVDSLSYNSIRSLRECANLSEVPTEVQRAILRDFYADDILTGANSIKDARVLQKQFVETLKRGRFDLRQWTSNESGIFLDRPPKYREANDKLEFLDKDHTIKTLGIVWQQSEDCFVFDVSHIERDNFERKNFTKRQMLSDISKTFDPLGWLSPVTIFLKQLLQRAWEANISWDDQLPSELADHYLKCRSKLISLKDVELQRFILLDGFSDKTEMHLFCDASECPMLLAFILSPLILMAGGRHLWLLPKPR